MQGMKRDWYRHNEPSEISSFTNSYKDSFERDKESSKAGYFKTGDMKKEEDKRESLQKVVSQSQIPTFRKSIKGKQLKSTWYDNWFGVV